METSQAIQVIQNIINSAIQKGLFITALIGLQYQT